MKLDGWAIESRLYAEDPYRNFLPSIGRLTRYRPPEERRTADVAVRNDTGVFEGGEISMYYDPMIAKLCTWAPDRAGAIAAMRTALDGFEVEGIGHNLPFLSAVMDHPRFVAGAITTAFIAEEYPEGFQGVTLPEAMLRRVAAAAAAMHRVAEIRRARISGTDGQPRAQGRGRLGGDAAEDGLPGDDRRRPDRRDGRASPTGQRMRVVSDWTPGQPLARLEVDGELLVLKVEPDPERLPGAACAARTCGQRAVAADGGARGAHAGEAAAGHLEAAALPDAGARGADRRRGGRRGLRRPGARAWSRR